ncbi:hypothetical protein ACQ4PT_071792 [Festuca glaucescens]
MRRWQATATRWSLMERTAPELQEAATALALCRAAGRGRAAAALDGTSAACRAGSPTRPAKIDKKSFGKGVGREKQWHMTNATVRRMEGKGHDTCTFRCNIYLKLEELISLRVKLRDEIVTMRPLKNYVPTSEKHIK